MGSGFWIIQATFLVAAIATAVSVEREHRRDERDLANAPYRKIRVEPSPSRRPRFVPTDDLLPIAGATLRGTSQFTLLEQSRLLLLRGSVQEARTHKGHLYDDLAPDETDHVAIPRRPTRSPRELQAALPAARVPASGGGSMRMSRRWSGQTLSLAAGVALLALGCVGIWRTNTQMDTLESAQQATIAAPKSSLMARLVPGVVANPGKFLGAVNSSSTSSGGDPILAVAMLEQKQTMDRYEAVLGIGLALLIGSVAGWPSRARSTVGETGEARTDQQSSIASDLVPFIVVAALLCAALSFFELV